MSTVRTSQKINIPQLQEMKERGEAIVMVAAYDYPSAGLADAAGLDIVLVGDSLAMTVLGHPNTLSVTVDEMLVFTRAAARACGHAMVVADMPYGSYTVNPDDAVRNALRFIQEAGAQAVKIEGGARIAPVIRRMVDAGVPVMGHIGLTPQSLAVLGGFRVQGRSADDARRLLDDAHAVEAAGAFSLVIEAVPGAVAGAITRRAGIPTIGIGAGPECGGQVLVWHDLFTLNTGHTARFVRRYGDAAALFTQGLTAYADDVRTGRYPAAEHTYSIPTRDRETVEHALLDAPPDAAGRRRTVDG